MRRVGARAVAVLFWASLLAMACSNWATPAPPQTADSSVLYESKVTGGKTGESPLADSLAGLSSPESAEQAWSIPGHHIRFERISLDEGLSQSVAQCIFQDSRGFLWVGTQDGLNRYDGYEFKVYRHDPEEPHALSNSFITSISEDGSGALWIGTYGGGLNRLDPETGQFTTFRNDPDDPGSLSGDQVLYLYHDRGGVLWIGTRGTGLNRFEGGKFIRYRHDPADPHSLSSNDVQAILEDSRGVLWVGTRDGLNRFDREAQRWRRYREDATDPHSLDGKSVRFIQEDHVGDLWVGTADGGLNRLDRASDTFVHHRHQSDDPHSLSSDDVKVILEDPSGTLWIGTSKGLDRFHRERERFIHYRSDPADPHSLSSNAIISLHADQSGGLWIGTFGGGLNHYDRRQEQFAHYRRDPSDPDSLSHNCVWSILEDRLGELWVGTDGGGLSRFDRKRGRWRQYLNDPEDPHSLSNDIVVSIYEDRSGELWIGTGGGLNRFDREGGRFYRYQRDSGDPHSLSSNQVFAIYEDRYGALWIGTAHGLSSLDRETGKFTSYYHDPEDPNSPSDNRITAIYQDRSGMLWLGTNSGLTSFDRETGQFARYQHKSGDPHSLSHNLGFAIHEDRAGRLWFGTWGGGLNRFDRESGRFTSYRVKDGLANDVVYGILEDSHGNLWLSTNNGISEFDPRTETFKNYGVADGLQSAEFNSHAYFRNSRGEMFFGGINGFTVFRAEYLRDNSYVPPIVLTSISPGGEVKEVGRPLENVTGIRLKWPHNGFEFEFAALSYSQRERNRHAYMLEGFDRDWNYVGTRRFGQYTNLPGGDYTLRLKGSNSDGVWNEQGTSVEVTVIPPVWATWWFRGLGALMLLGLLIGGYRLRVQRVEARSRQLEALVEERTRALEERTAEAERRKQELEALYRAEEELNQAEEELYRALRLDQVLGALVNVAVDLLKADKSSLMVWDAQRERLVVGAACGFSAERLAQMSWAPGEGIVGRVAASGEPTVVEDALTDPRVNTSLTGPEQIRSFMSVPIKVGGQVFGVFNAEYSRPKAFNEDDRRRFLALAQRAALGIENARLYEQAQQAAVLEERQRLARELHDSVTQSLYSVTLFAEAGRRLVGNGDLEPTTDCLGRLGQTAQQALKEMRLLVYELRPSELGRDGLVGALQQRLNAVEDRAGVEAHLLVTGPADLPRPIEEGLYWIAQEALNNALKHANARSVTVQLHAEESLGFVRLEVEDDGTGFDLRAAADGGGMGLISMRERAARLGGTLEVISSAGQGTRVEVQVTLD